MALVGAAFLDTSILLGGLIEIGGRGDDAQRLMDAVAGGRLARPLTAWHCCLEFLSVATRLPEEYRLEPADARLLLEEEILARMDVHDLPSERRGDFVREVAALPAIGGRIYDVHVGRVAVEAGARVFVTENGKHFGFLGPCGVSVVGAREYLADT